MTRRAISLSSATSLGDEMKMRRFLRAAEERLASRLAVAAGPSDEKLTAPPCPRAP